MSKEAKGGTVRPTRANQQKKDDTESVASESPTLSEGSINSQQMDNLQESMTLMITAMTRNEEEKLQRELDKEDLKKERRALELAQENRRSKWYES